MFTANEIVEYINTNYPSLTAHRDHTSEIITVTPTPAVLPATLPIHHARPGTSHPLTIKSSDDAHTARYRDETNAETKTPFATKTGLSKTLEVYINAMHARYFYALTPGAPATGTIDKLLKKYDHPYELYQLIDETPEEILDTNLHLLDIDDINHQSTITKTKLRNSTAEHYRVLYRCPNCRRTLQLFLQYDTDTPGLPPTTTAHAETYAYCPPCDNATIPRTHLLTPTQVFTNA